MPHVGHSGARHLFAELPLWAARVRERGSHARACPTPLTRAPTSCRTSEPSKADARASHSPLSLARPRLPALGRARRRRRCLLPQLALLQPLLAEPRAGHGSGWPRLARPHHRPASPSPPRLAEAPRRSAEPATTARLPSLPVKRKKKGLIVNRNFLTCSLYKIARHKKLHLRAWLI